MGRDNLFCSYTKEICTLFLTGLGGTTLCYRVLCGLLRCLPPVQIHFRIGSILETFSASFPISLSPFPLDATPQPRRCCSTLFCRRHTHGHPSHTITQFTLPISLSHYSSPLVRYSRVTVIRPMHFGPCKCSTL